MLRKFEPSDKKNTMESKTDLAAARKYFLEGNNFRGGVNYHTIHLPVGDRGCKFLKKADKVLVKAAPQVFAMGCKVVIQKK